MTTSVRWRGPSHRGGEQMDIEGNQQMDMDNNDNDIEHKNETDEHETGDSTASGSRCRSMRKSHAVMPPLVLDSDDEKIVIKPTSDG
jgi:hypothetical protein